MKFRCGYIFIISSILIIASLTPSIASKNNDSTVEYKTTLLKPFFNGVIDIDYDSEFIPDTIEPEKEIVKIPIYIYHYVAGFGSGVIIPLLKNKIVPIKLSIEAPDYCNCEITPDIVYQPLNTKKPDKPQVAILTVSLNRSSPAFQTNLLTIKAESQPIKGPLGLISILGKGSQHLTIPVTAGYYPDLSYSYQNFVLTPPFTTSKIPINLINNGNGRTSVRFEVIDFPENWSLYINPHIAIGFNPYGENNTASTLLAVVPPIDFINKCASITIKLEYYATGHHEEIWESTIKIIFYYPEDFAQIYNDPFGDVKLLDRNLTHIGNTTEFPNVDIKKVKFIRYDNTDTSTICINLDVFGKIENLGKYSPLITLDNVVMYDFDFKTSTYDEYSIIYINKTCHIRYPDSTEGYLDFYVLNGSLIFSFDLLDSNETFEKLEGRSLYTKINQTSFKFCVDSISYE